MGRPSSIVGTAIEERVNALLDAGETLAEVSAQTGASLSALSRHNIARKSHLARVIDAEPDMYSLIQRLLDAADDARAARLHAQRGSAAARARAISTEAALLGRLLENLGVTDSRVSEELQTASGLALAIRDHVLHDEASVSIIPRIREVNGLAELASALERTLERGTA